MSPLSCPLDVVAWRAWLEGGDDIWGYEREGILRHSVYKMRVGYYWGSKGVTGMLPKLGAQGFGKVDGGKSIILLSLVVRKVHWLLLYIGENTRDLLYLFIEEMAMMM